MVTIVYNLIFIILHRRWSQHRTPIDVHSSCTISLRLYCICISKFNWLSSCTYSCMFYARALNYHIFMHALYCSNLIVFRDFGVEDCDTPLNFMLTLTKSRCREASSIATPTQRGCQVPCHAARRDCTHARCRTCTHVTGMTDP